MTTKVKAQEDFFTKIPFSRYEELLYVLLQAPRDLNPWDERCRMGIPAIFWGLSGVGKSERLDAVAEQVLRMPLERLMPVSYPPENFVGVPVIVGKNVKSVVLIGQIRRLLREGLKDAVLIIDEASDANRLTQGAMQPLILDRRVGDDVLPPGIRIMLLANPPRYSAGGFELVAALANRLGHFYLPVEEDAIDAFCNHLEDPTPPRLIPFKRGIEAIKDGWRSSWAATVGEVTTFHRTFRDLKLLHNQPEAGTVESGGSWPSLRTWKTAMQCITARRCLGMDSRLDPYLMQAFIGEAAASKWGTWAVYKDLPTPEQILSRDKGWDIGPETRIDRVSVMASGVATYVVAEGNKETQVQMATVAWEWLELLADNMFKDIAVRYGDKLCAKGLANKAQGELRATARRVLRKLTKSKVMDV